MNFFKVEWQQINFEPFTFIDKYFICVNFKIFRARISYYYASVISM
jgi:hypothetical protein